MGSFEERVRAAELLAAQSSDEQLSALLEVVVHALEANHDVDGMQSAVIYEAIYRLRREA